MTNPSVILALQVGRELSLSDAVDIASAAAHHGVTAVRILDGDGDAHGETLDATPVAAYLAGLYPQLNWLIEAPTTHNAPYNLARRILSFDRATAGRSGVVLRVGDGDEVSDASVPDPAASSPAQRWIEYAQVLTALWESFPREALLGDQAAGIFVDDNLISGIDHDGAFYRVAGPLDGPTSVQGRPVLVVDDLDVLGWDTIARTADVVVARSGQVPGAAVALYGALGRVGRPRPAVALIGRAPAVDIVDYRTDDLAAWVHDHELDGVELVVSQRADALQLIEHTIARLRPSIGTTLRSALGLPQLVGAPA